MPNFADCMAYPPSLWGENAQRHIIYRHAIRFPVALRRLEALEARWSEPANVADGRGGFGDICQCRNLGGA